jgi:hypothetical protein
MAYKTIVAKAYANRDAFMADLWTQLAAMGWTLVDGSCTPVTVAYTAVSVANDTFTAAGHTFVDGQPVMLKTTGTAPGGLAVLTQYYVRNISGDDFKLSTTYNGSAVNITSQGTGNHTVTESYRVYSTNGEAGDKIPECIKISMVNSATVLHLTVSYSWNATTHAIIGSAIYTSDSLATSESGFYAWIYGNKTIVMLVTKVGTTYVPVVFGMPPPFIDLSTTLTADATAGDNAVLTVASSAGFEVGYKYQILGAEQEGRDRLTVTAIGSATSITVSNLPRNYAAGARLAITASTMLVTKAVASYHASPIAVAGTANVTSWGSGTFSDVIFISTSADPDFASEKYILSPLLITGVQDGVGNANYSVGMYNAEYILKAPYNAALVNEDTFSVGVLSSGTSSGSNNATTLNDTSKSWTVNAYAGKCVVITFGVGVGQIKKIASNTATALTLADGWTFETTPTTSTYQICDEAYRYHYLSTTAGFAAREGV